MWRVVHKSTTSNCFLLLALLILPSFWFPSEGALYKEVAFFSLARAKVTSKYKSKKVLLAFTAALLFLALTSLLAAAAVVTPASLFCAVLKHSKYGMLHQIAENMKSSCLLNFTSFYELWTAYFDVIINSMAARNSSTCRIWIAVLWQQHSGMAAVLSSSHILEVSFF